MAKHRYGMDIAKITRFHEERRGEGQGADYKPWLTVQDLSSLGRSSRVWGWKTGRIHHFFSDHETRLFLIYQWSDAVTDIREQFPLDQDTTLQLAESANITHPKDPSSRTPIVMTTDFLIDINCGGKTYQLARAVKPSRELSNPRVIEKLELERQYWLAQGVDWGIVTEHEISTRLARNIAWANEMRILEVQSDSPMYWENRCRQFLMQLIDSPDERLGGFLRQLEASAGFQQHEGLTVLRHLVAHKRIQIDMNRQLDLSGSLKQLVMVTADRQRMQA